MRPPGPTGRRSSPVSPRERIGFPMAQAREFLRTDVTVVCLVVHACLGLLADFIVRSLERLLQWRPTFTGR